MSNGPRLLVLNYSTLPPAKSLRSTAGSEEEKPAMLAATTRAMIGSLSISGLIVATASAAPNEATVVSTVKYQEQLTLSCSTNVCSGTFPTIADKRRVNLSRLSCQMTSTSGVEFQSGQITIQNSLDQGLGTQFLTDVFSASSGIHTINQAIDLQVEARKKMFVILRTVDITANTGFCTATGTMDRLQ